MLKALKRWLKRAPHHPAATPVVEHATPEADLQPALLRLQQRDPAGAETLLREHLRHWPHSASALHLCAIAVVQLGRGSEAQELLAAAVQVSPERADLRVDLGNVCRVMGEEAVAAGHYRAALEIDPSLGAAWSNLCLSLHRLGRHADAVHAGREAVRHAPQLADAHNNLGLALQGAGALGEAEQVLRALLTALPAHADACNNLGNVLVDRGWPKQGCEALERSLELAPAHAGAVANLLLSLHYRDDISGAAMFDAHRRHAARLTVASALPPREHTHARPLRIGYLSADLRTHSVACFIEPVLAAHDRAAVHVTAYASVTRPDDTTRRIATACDRWREVAAFDDAALARLVREDGIDVLIDLGGHTAGSRLPVLAHRPAPLQGTWIGYPDTTGMETVDFRVTDARADPPGEADGLHTERLLRLPGGFLCYQPAPDAPAVVPPPSQAGAPFTFGCFNNAAKLNRAVAALWSRLLAAVPASRLLLKARQLDDASTRERFQALLVDAGIEPGRLLLEGWSNERAAHLARYAEVDIALDTFPYNGTTTTCEALWMGVPVLCVQGTRHSGRVGASLLHSAGLPELLAASEEEFLRIGTGLAGDAGRLAALRAELRQRLAASALTDARRCAAELERSIVELLETRC